MNVPRFAALVLLFVFCVQPNYAIDILHSKVRGRNDRTRR